MSFSSFDTSNDLSIVYLIIQIFYSVSFSDLPPNQGGKYSGFGYTMDPPPRSTSQEFVDNALSSLASVSFCYVNRIEVA